MAIQGSTVVEATLFWPFLTKKNEMAGKFTVDLGKLDKATMKAIKDIGLRMMIVVCLLHVRLTSLLRLSICQAWMSMVVL